MVRVALLAVLACACRGEPVAEPMIEVASYAAVPARELDILFQIDDSPGGDVGQRSLGIAFPQLVDALSSLEGGLPDLHVGVVSGDLGTSGSMGNPAPSIGSIGQGGCAERGKDGLLQVAGAPVQGTFLVDEDDGGLRRRNYTGMLTDVFAQMLLLGAGGCGFEQPLAATMRAFANNANVGFSRPEANLLVVIVADEDDCSIRDPAIVGPESAELGPLTSFRCTRFGVECDEPLDSAGPKTNCRPQDDSRYVEGITPFVDFMRTTRGDPARVAVAAIVGTPAVAIEPRAPPGGGAAQLALAHSCTWQSATGPVVADPAVRIAAAIDELGPNSTLESVCSDNFAPAVAGIARIARGLYGITCLDTARVGTGPACSVTVEDLAGETPLSLCPATGDCFEIVTDAAACPAGDHLRLLVHLAAPTAEQYVRARCVAI